MIASDVLVGRGHRAVVALELDLRGAMEMRHDGGAGLGGGIGEDGGGPGKIESRQPVCRRGHLVVVLSGLTRQNAL